jgi:hypothetical protein
MVRHPRSEPLLDALGNSLNPGIEKQSHESHVAPDVDRSNGRQSKALIAEEGDRSESEGVQHGIAKSEQGIKHPEPKVAAMTFAIR